MLEAALTVKQVAAALQVKDDVVLRKIKSGELIACNINPGGIRPRWRIMESEFNRYVVKTRVDMKAPEMDTIPRLDDVDYFVEGVIE